MKKALFVLIAIALLQSCGKNYRDVEIQEVKSDAEIKIEQENTLQEKEKTRQLELELEIAKQNK